MNITNTVYFNVFNNTHTSAYVKPDQTAENNKNTPINKSELLKMGKNIPANNIIHTIFSMESEVVPKETIANAYQVINEIFNRVDANINTISKLSPKDKLLFIHDIIYKQMKFTKSSGILVSESLAATHLDCDECSFVFLALAEKYSWPIRAVRLPGHMFIRWIDKNNKFNFDTQWKDHFPSDDYYIEVYKLSKTATDNGNYMKGLSRVQIAAVITENVGLDLYEKGDIRSAMDYLNKAINIDPKYSDACTQLGMMQLKSGNMDLAFKTLNKAIELDPSEYKAYFYRGNILEFKGDRKGALNNYNLAMECSRENKSKEFISTLINRGIVLAELGKINAAIESLNLALMFHPDDLDALYNRGLVSAKIHNFNAAIKDFSRIIEIDPTNTEAYYNRAVAKNKFGDIYGANEDINKYNLLKRK